MDYTIKIIINDKSSNPPGKLADAELHFSDGVLGGLKLIGFSVWKRRTGHERYVTFPARQYFALLEPIVDVASQERVRDAILEAYAAHERGDEFASPS